MHAEAKRHNPVGSRDSAIRANQERGVPVWLKRADREECVCNGNPEEAVSVRAPEAGRMLQISGRLSKARKANLSGSI